MVAHHLGNGAGGRYRVVHHRRFVLGLLLMLSTVAIATDQLSLAVVVLLIGVVLVASSHGRVH